MCVGDAGTHGRQQRGRVLIIVQNLPVPFDRRVLARVPGAASRRATTCTSCARRRPGDPTHDGARRRRRCTSTGRAPPARGALGYLGRVRLVAAHDPVADRAARARRRAVRRDPGLQPARHLLDARDLFAHDRGCRFVYDQHDLCPELFESRFAEPRPSLAKALLWLERRTYRAADHVIATNESYARVAMSRGAAPAR